METVAPIFTALIALAMAISTLVRGARDRLHQEYAWLAGVMSIVFLCLFFVIISEDTVWRYGLLVSALLVAPAALQVFSQILRNYDPPFRLFVPVLYVLAVPQMVAIFVLGPGSSTVIAINASLVFGGLTIGVVGIYRLNRQLTRPVERSRVGSLLWVGAVATAGMGIEMAFLDWNLIRHVPEGEGLLFPPFGSLLVAAYIYYLGQVIHRRRLLDRHEIVSRISVFVVMAIVLGAVYGVLVRLIGQAAGPMAEAIDILIASILVLILYEPVKLAMEKQVDRYIARDRAHYIAALVDMKQRLPGLIELDSLLDTLFDGTLLTGRLDLSSIYLYDEARDGFRLRRFEGDPEQPLMSAFAQRPFIDGFLEGRSWYALEELEAQLFTGQTPDWLDGAVATMRSLQAGVCLPLRIGATVIGVWNLRRRPSSPALSADELELLAGLADQVAVLVDNSRAFERLKERDRLASLGEMSAGLAHEIRNPLGAIKGAVQVLARNRSSAQDREFLGIIIEEVDRLDGVVRQFLDYARPMNMRVDETDPDLLLASVLAMAEAEGLPQNVRIDYQPGSDVPPIAMDVEKLKQVIINVVRNGIQAMGREGGTLTVRTSALLQGSIDEPGSSLRSRAPGRADQVRVKRGHMGARESVEISFEDEGKGIAQDDAGKLFIPFFTTKAQGTGLGLPICERIVREHGGEIEVESVLGAGTRLVLRLPLWDDEPPPVDESIDD
jgi:two-component system, NtrC family, sensor histidine kinase HydH